MWPLFKVCLSTCIVFLVGIGGTLVTVKALETSQYLLALFPFFCMFPITAVILAKFLDDF